jgi:3-oxoacyl-[acyl-carrier-protein] synthase II
MSEAWTRLTAGVSGVARVSRFNPAAFGLETHIAGEVKGFDPADHMDARDAGRMDRFSHFAVAAAAEALRESGLVIDAGNRDRIGVVFATGMGGLQTFSEQADALRRWGPERVSPLTVPMLAPAAAAGAIGRRFGVRGPGMAVASACASSNDAIGMALAAIQLGWVNAAVTGGAEALVSPLAIAGFNRAGALATRFNETPERASRPFDRDRDGFVLAEMGTALVLETLEHARRRGAPILAELAGYGASMDAHHLTAPASDGNGAVRAMRAALECAGVAPEEIDYISAHGTSTPSNDPIETRAVKAVFGERAYRIPVSAIKSMTGHAAGGCGALEAAALTLSFAEGVVPPTINLDTPDPECDLDYVPHVARRAELRAALSNTSGFGGHNSCLVLRRVRG